MLIGAHVSVSSGYIKALDYAQSVGCECAQVFAKSPRQWRGGSIDPEAAREFAAERAARGFGPLYTHTSYLINLAAIDPEMREKSIAALADELVRGSVLGAAGVVSHIGADAAGDPAAASKRIGSAIIEASERAGGDGCHTRLLLENTAGAGSTVGSTFSEIALCIRATDLPSERLGVCLDTCHAFAYGYRVDTAQGWAELVAEIGETIGVERLGLIHANDCKFGAGEKKDRHEWIGDGFIGLAGFEAMVCVPELAGVSVVTEMPGEVPEKDAVNVLRLIALREACAESQ
ncbi:MAG: deoxyribonuclease IV [Actinobacteria bacterium HGW-Actinobacteria-7]|jgi:deoxyribonuclease-4|nr:MAG: deoxyribonuclease IV [Actinobacteria bacterium HGW-Actinobacteria-7]